MCNINKLNVIAPYEHDSPPTPPPCQVKDQEPSTVTVFKGKGRVSFSLPADAPTSAKATKYRRKWGKRAQRRDNTRDAKAANEDAMLTKVLRSVDFDKVELSSPTTASRALSPPATSVATTSSPPATSADTTSGSNYCYAGAGYSLRRPRQHRNITENERQYKEGVLNNTIPSAIADAVATSHC